MHILDGLYEEARRCAIAVLAECDARGLRVRIPATGGRRTEQDQRIIYGKERWTLHYIGLAVDIEPVLQVAPKNWQREYNTWPHWDLLQCEIAPACGFDTPAKWQRERDRPHNQCLFGLSEPTLRQMWYASNGNLQEIWRYIDLHRGRV